MNRLLQNKKGFSLLEILVVLGIVGILFAIILPRAWRARVDTNYSLIRQAAVELGSWGMEWSERNLTVQAEGDSCKLNDYVNSLRGYTGGKREDATPNNWFGAVDTMTSVCRSTAIRTTVNDIMPQENQPRNPFTGVNYLHVSHDGSRAEPGLLYLAMLADGDGFNNYHFLYTGAEPTSATDWHAGMGDGLPPTFAGLRNGIYVARFKP